MLQKPPRLPPGKRKEIIKEYIAQETTTQIAYRCGVTRKTISTDIRAMRETGEWDEWIEKEFLRLHQHPEIKPTTKYIQMAILYGRTKAQRIKAEIEGPAQIVVNFDKSMEIKASEDEPDT